MQKKIIQVLAGMLVATGFCCAQTAPAQDTPHRAYDQKARECKRLAAEQKLTGEEFRTFIANCMKQ